ncbi:hypothetical protein [Peribacillus kribbensis]|uniref:hypothetical protein n=1 Tax=Peribacillus kribbensis TaxID=356658 RepID=UPI00040ED6E8|nr:hypothetical protein [Peribacillus kribbensis]
MSKRNFLLPALAAGTAAYFVMNKNNRVKMKLWAEDSYNCIKKKYENVKEAEGK